MTYTPPEGVTIGSFTAGTLPASFRAPADAVISYKIYGTSEGAGVETESGEPAGYKIPILCTSGVTENLWDLNSSWTNSLIDTKAIFTPQLVQYNGNKMLSTAGISVYDNGHYSIRSYLADTDYTRIYVKHNGSTRDLVIGNIYSDFKKDKRYIISFDVSGYDPTTVGGIKLENIMLTEGSTPPDHYIPHRYTSNYDLFIGNSKLGEDEYVDFTTQKIYKLQEGELTPTDPPLPLPSIITYDGENTISSTETLGDVEFTGEWTAIMGSTEDESIDIGFTVDADSYIAFVTVDDDPSIQVFDTITMPASAGSFTLQVVSWGREQYTDTVYNALS